MENAQFLVTCSFMEIYMESLTDLLSDSKGSSVQIREDPVKGIYIEGLTEHVTHSSPEIEGKDKGRAVQLGEARSTQQVDERDADEPYFKSLARHPADRP